MAKLPWYIWTSLASVSCILIGGYWDISWHMTIGRDSFWTPAHIAIQLGGIISGAAGTALILTTTFGKNPRLRDASVRVWGFRGPLGAFFGVWGAATMLVSAPFDNWWHAAYGLDVKILSPPHTVLTLGILGVSTGGVLTIVAALNRAAVETSSPIRQRLDLAILAIAGAALTLGMVAILESTFRSNLHRSDAYRAIGLVAPLLLIAFARVSRQRWAATIVAGTYMTFMVVCLWLFPLFPAEAKLGPVYQPISHFIPLQFPMLVIAPAFACDLALARWGERPRWQLAPLLGVLFVVVLVAAQWPFADFLMSEHARNRVFGAHYMPYMMRPDWHETRFEFFEDPALVPGILKAALYATGSSLLGLLFGDALRKVKR